MLYFCTMPKNPQNSHPATKSDIGVLKADASTLKTNVGALKTDIQGLDKKLDKLQNTLDGFVGRVDDLTIENQIGVNQTRELREQVESHEGRITRLESSQQ